MRAHPIIIAALALIVLIAGAWGALALCYRAPGLAHMNIVLAALWGLFCLAATYCLFTRYRDKALTFFALIFAALMAWWITISPLAVRDWAPEVARIVKADIDDDIVTLHNVRNFKWRTESDYNVFWEDRTYNLNNIESVDLFLSYWGMPAIAHVMVGFNFKDNSHVVFSVEIRKENGEVFSNIAGLFKQYELSLIAADEKDIIYLRTNIRGEDVYRYPLLMKPESRKKLFLSYIEEGGKLTQSPEFYNTITANCSVVVYNMVRAINPGLHWDYRILLSGYLPEYLYRINAIDESGPLQSIVRKAAITKKARETGYRSNYSDLIRTNNTPTID